MKPYRMQPNSFDNFYDNDINNETYFFGKNNIAYYRNISGK